jgi:hypothetical protein
VKKEKHLENQPKIF